jgi:hypothetical protein
LSEQFLGVPPCLELVRAFYSCRFKGKKKMEEEEGGEKGYDDDAEEEEEERKKEEGEGEEFFGGVWLLSLPSKRWTAQGLHSREFKIQLQGLEALVAVLRRRQQARVLFAGGSATGHWYVERGSSVQRRCAQSECPHLDLEATRPDEGHAAHRRGVALHFTVEEARPLGLHVPRRPRQTTDFPRRQGAFDHCSFLFNMWCLVFCIL